MIINDCQNPDSEIVSLSLTLLNEILISEIAKNIPLVRIAIRNYSLKLVKKSCFDKHRCVCEYYIM